MGWGDNGPTDTSSGGNGSMDPWEPGWQQENQEMEDNLPSALQQWAMTETGMTYRELQDRAARYDMSPQEYAAAVRDSSQFNNDFPGLNGSGGSSGGGMSTSEYQALSDQYTSAARVFGINLPKSAVGDLIKSDISMQEFNDRMTAIQRIGEYKPAFKEFQQVLQSRGISTKGIESDKEILEFMLGRGPKQFYKMWDELTVGTSARMAGVHINQKLTKSIARRLPGQQTEAQLQAGMQALAQQIQTTLPLSKIGKYGLTKKDLVTLEFGGPGQAQIAQKVQTVLKNHQSFAQEKRAHVQTGEFGQASQQDRAQV